MDKPIINIDKQGPNGNIYAIIGKAQAAIMEKGFKALQNCPNYMVDGDIITANFVTAGELMKNRAMAAPSYEEAIKAIEEYVTINWI